MTNAGKAARARRIAARAAYGSTGMGAISAGLLGVLKAQAKSARRRIGEPTEQPPRPDAIYGGEHSGEPLHLAMLGDSSAGGLGVASGHETPGALLAAGLATAARRPVRLTNVSRVGATSEYVLTHQVDLALAQRPLLAAIMVGANDVTHTVRPSESVRHLGEAVRRLRDADVQVVVGTCPDLGTIKPLPQPLRWVARRWSRQLAAAQTIAVVEAGGRSVSLGDLLGPEFDAKPLEMFAADGFHPSAAGYRAAADALLPSVVDALGYGSDGAPVAALGESVIAIADAAVEAAAHAGTEVSSAQVAGADRGPRGRWAQLRHRRQGVAPRTPSSR